VQKVSLTQSLYEDQLIVLLRWSLALIFIWFGLLKVAGYNPVSDLVSAVSPFLASGVGLVLLGIFETAVGVGLIVNRFRTFVYLLLVFHLIGTFLTFLTGVSVVFHPHFPILSLDGEFVIKNLVLAASGLLVLLHQSTREQR